MARGGGPKCSYEPDRHPDLAKWMARTGLTNEEIAKSPEFNLSVSQFYRWLARYPELCEAVKAGRQFVDVRVEDSLLRRALGYTYDEVEVMASEDGKKKRVKKVTKQVAGDVTAQIFWLKNRQPERWRDTKDHTTGGKPFKVYAGFDPEEV